MKNLILIFMAAILLASCTSTQIVKTWNEPGASVSLSAANKTMVLAMVKDETSRRVIEDQLVKRLNGKAVASYTVISTEMLKQASEEELNKKLTDGQFTHVLIMRLGDVEKETTYV